MIDNDGEYQNEYDENEEYMEQNEEEINQTDLNENQNNLEQIREPPIDSKKAIEDYKKICVKTYTSPNNIIIFQLIYLNPLLSKKNRFGRSENFSKGRSSSNSFMK